MKPIVMLGHSRPITSIKYNYDGDLIFSAGKDTLACLWNSTTGEKIGVYSGHTGAIFDLDINHNSTRLVTAGADSSVIIWDVQTGQILAQHNCTGPVTCCAFDESGTKIACGIRLFKDHPPKVLFFEIPSNLSPETKEIQMIEPYLSVSFPNEKQQPSCVGWMSLNEGVIICFDNGHFQIMDPRDGNIEATVEAHSGKITDLAFDRRKIFFITSSEDQTAKLYDAKTLTHLKTYTSDVPINAAVISLSREHILLGGGQTARDVTTASDAGGFQARLFYLIYETQFGSISGHFGPINAIDMNPDERSYVSGSEDGIMRLHHFDESYLSMEDLLDQDTA